MAPDLATDAALHESEERYRRLVEYSPSGILVYQGGKIVEINRAGVRLFGASSEREVLGKPLTNFVRPESRRQLEDQLQCVREVAERLAQEHFLQLDGSPIQAEVTAFSVVHKGGAAAQLIFRDVTERKRMEAALHTSEEIRTVAANMPVILFALDRAGVFTLSEGRGLGALGLKPGEVVGRSVFEVYRGVPEILNAVHRALAGESSSCTLQVAGIALEILV